MLLQWAKPHRPNTTPDTPHVPRMLPNSFKTRSSPRCRPRKVKFTRNCKTKRGLMWGKAPERLMWSNDFWDPTKWSESFMPTWLFHRWYRNKYTWCFDFANFLHILLFAPTIKINNAILVCPKEEDGAGSTSGGSRTFWACGSRRGSILSLCDWFAKLHVVQKQPLNFKKETSEVESRNVLKPLALLNVKKKPFFLGERFWDVFVLLLMVASMQHLGFQPSIMGTAFFRRECVCLSYF